jgi:hypothetical protein
LPSFGTIMAISGGSAMEFETNQASGKNIASFILRRSRQC